MWLCRKWRRGVRKKVLELLKCKNLRTEKSKNAKIRANQLQNIDEYMKLIKNVYEQ